jgi:hypothetical protein
MYVQTPKGLFGGDELERAEYDDEQDIEDENNGSRCIECASSTHRVILLSDPR